MKIIIFNTIILPLCVLSFNLLFAQIVRGQAIDFAVKVVEYFGDVKVKIVDYFEGEKWKVVGACRNFPNLKVKIVDYFEDRTIFITNVNSIDRETLIKLKFLSEY